MILQIPALWLWQSRKQLKSPWKRTDEMFLSPLLDPHFILHSFENYLSES
jgi:hypothetical protein